MCAAQYGLGQCQGACWVSTPNVDRTTLHCGTIDAAATSLVGERVQTDV